MKKKYLSGKSDAYLRNLLLMYREIIAKKAVLDTKPTEFVFGPTTNCNYQCIMCPNLITRRSGFRHELDADFYKNLNPLLPYLSGLNISGGGEPFTSRHFVKFLTKTDWSPYPDLEITITSNGSLLTPDMIKKLYHVPFRGFIISLNAATPETYKKINGKDTFNAVLDNIRFLADNAGSFAFKKPHIQLSFVVMKSNYFDIPAFIKIVRDLKCALRFLPVELNVSNPVAYYESLVIPKNKMHLREAQRIIHLLAKKHQDDLVIYQYLAALSESLEKQTIKTGFRINPVWAFISKFRFRKAFHHAYFDTK